MTAIFLFLVQTRRVLRRSVLPVLRAGTANRFTFFRERHYTSDVLGASARANEEDLFVESVAQKMTYCLRKMGAIDIVGKQGRTLLYDGE